MQIPRLALLLLCAAGPLAQAAERTQAANFTPLVSLGLPSGVTNAPSAVRGDLLLGSDGAVWFASSGGGNGRGTISRLAPDGTLGVVYVIEDSAHGINPYAGLMQADDGNFYGTTYFGGENSVGVVFRITPAGEYTVLYSFGNESLKDGFLPYTGLVQGPDGFLYGTTLRGGANDMGIVYRISTAGNYSVIHEFSGSDGGNPEGRLIVGHDGLLYGTTLQGGSDNRGVIYRISTSGTFERLYSFPRLGAFTDKGLAANSTGANPRSGLLLASDGNYYGTAYQGGEHGNGTLFRMTPGGEVSVLHAFTGFSHGAGFPLASPVQGPDGSLYGTSVKGGYLDVGAAWRVDLAGNFTLLHGFTGAAADGNAPYAGLLFAQGGLLTLSTTDTINGTGAILRLDTGNGGNLPIELTLSSKEIEFPGAAQISWSAPDAVSCRKTGEWASDDDIAITGSESIQPFLPGIYVYGIRCIDLADVFHHAWAGLVVSTPRLAPIDGGRSGGGALPGWLLLLLAAVLAAKVLRENRSACP